MHLFTGVRKLDNRRATQLAEEKFAEIKTLYGYRKRQGRKSVSF